MTLSRKQYLFWIYAITAILVWGSAFTAIQIGLESFGPGELAFLRFASASIAALFLFFSRMKMPQKQDVPRLILVSISGFTGYHLLLNFGQRVVPPGTAALIVQTTPVWTALLASRFTQEKITVREWIGVGIALTGTIFIVLGQGKNIEFTLNALLILFATFCTTIYFVFGASLNKKYGPGVYTTWAIWIGTLPMFAFSWTALHQITTAKWQSLVAVVFLGIFPTVIGYVLWMRVVKIIGASRAAFFLYITPVVTVITAWLWYGTIPTILTLCGGAVVISGVAVINTKRQRG